MRDFLETLPGLSMVLFNCAIIGLIVFQVRLGRRNRAAVGRGDGLRAMVPALGGEVTRDLTHEGPVLRFQSEGVPALCHQWMLFDSRPDVVTTIEGRVRFRAFLQATSLDALRYPSKSPRFREIGIAESFRIITTDPSWGKEVLDAGLRGILQDLGRRWPRARIQLAVDRFLIEVESPVIPGQAQFLSMLVARVAALGKESDFSHGVTFVGDVGIDCEGRCPVCGQPFEVAGVQCAQCRIPHHPDCWAYWGRCAIFGCGGRRSSVPTSASPG